MNKKLIIEKLVGQLEQLRQETRAAYEANKSAANEAPGAMQSHSDTSKFQLGLLADELLGKVAELERAIEYAPKAGIAVHACVEVGALVEAKENDREFFYLIVPEGAGGQEISVDEKVVKTISENSPLAKALMNKKTGDRVEFITPSQTRVMEIVSIE